MESKNFSWTIFLFVFQNCLGLVRTFGLWVCFSQRCRHGWLNLDYDGKGLSRDDYFYYILTDVCYIDIHIKIEGSSWSRSYGSWIYNYLCNQCLSPLTLLVRIPLRRGLVNITFYYDKVCQWLAAGLQVLWFPPPIKLTTSISRYSGFLHQ